MPSRVLLTGVSGFFGSHMLEHLLTKTDWDIVGLASWKHKGTPERVDTVLDGHPEWKDRVTIITHDLESPLTERTIKRLGHIDYILNIASDSHVDRSIEDPVPFIENNVNLALTMFELARALKPKIFLQFSTDEVYGVAPPGVNHAEWSPIVPSNPYSASKACQEAIAIAYWRTYNVPLVLTNTMNLFGETQDAEKYLAKVIRQIEAGEEVTVHGTPTSIGSRFYLHARNAADAVLYILQSGPPTSYSDAENHILPDRYNIVGDRELDNLQVAEAIADVLGKPLKFTFTDFHSTRPGHDRRYALDGAKLREAGWVAPLGFEESLRKFINWTLSHPTWL
jgi:dTDP-glucose 4,6-dehydratase